MGSLLDRVYHPNYRNLLNQRKTQAQTHPHNLPPAHGNFPPKMAGDTGAPHQISLFRSQITTRRFQFSALTYILMRIITYSLNLFSLSFSCRFNDESLRILESLLVFKDVKSQIETRSDLKQFLRFESLSIFHEIKYKTVYQKLFILQFFVRAFALIGDTEAAPKSSTSINYI